VGTSKGDSDAALIRFRLRSGEVIEVSNWDSMSEVDLSAAQLVGVVELLDPHRNLLVQFHSRWIQRLQLVPKSSIAIDLSVDAPIPGFVRDPMTEERWTFRIATDAQSAKITRPWTVAATIPWFKSAKTVTGRCGSWLTNAGSDEFELLHGVPLDKLGLSQDAVPGYRFARVGLFVADSGKRSTLVCVMLPVQAGNIIGNLSLANFRAKSFRCSAGNMSAAMAAHFDARTLADGGDGSPWFSFFQWRANTGVAPDDILAELWKPLAETNATGLRGTHSARHWWPVPVFDKTNVKNADWLQRLVLSLPIRAGAKPALRRLGHWRVPEGDKATTDVVFNWYADQTRADRLKPLPRPGRTLALSGELKFEEFAAPWPDKDDVGGAIADAIEALVTDADPTALAQWTVQIRAIAPVGGWLNFGSIDIFPAIEIPENAPDITLECTLVGTWNEDICDVYSQIKLANLPCQFRMSSTGDALPQTLVAQFDVVNRIEDELQRPAQPIVERFEKDPVTGQLLNDALGGTLNLRVQAEPGREAVTQVSLRREDFESPSGRALYLQMRPYNFARVWPATFDEEAGLDFGYWRSDDPEGPQWRVPDATIEFDLPTQTVAEEMERGDRFWGIDNDGNKAPYIDPTRPLKFRFAPPTHLRVRPSRVPRRYNRNINNLSDILDSAHVEAFSTELLYPIQLDFEVHGKPAIDIGESGSFIGQPSPNLPLRKSDDGASRELAEDVFPADIAEWFMQAVAPMSSSLDRFQEQYDEMRWSQSGNRAQFVSRIAQFHVHDPSLPGRQLMLSDGLKAGLRTPEPGTALHGKSPPGSMPFPMNPLPLPVDLDAEQKSDPKTKAFLASDGSWGNLEDGALRAGAIHTMEFPSELAAVLRAPAAVSAFIETLCFSVIGASGASSVSFDEGRTTFSVEISDGQVWRIRKIRLGRIALFWNKAKHVVVYERSVVPSWQFQRQQPNDDTFGWPILRKTEEYVEPIEMVRVFADEPEGARGSTAFANASEFVTPRIYVDGAWGRDLGHGYEIPLWNPADTSGFYPKPHVAVAAHAGGGEASRLWHEGPEELYFYSNTQPGTGPDSDKWAPFHGVDLPANGPSRRGVLTNTWLTSSSQVLDSVRIPSPRPGGLRRKRFDLRVRSDGPVDLQQGRGETPMLAPGVDIVSLARTDETSVVATPTGSPIEQALAEVRPFNDAAGMIDSLRDEAATFLRDLPALYLKFQLAGCATLQAEMTSRADALFQRMNDAAAKAFASVPTNGAADIDQQIARLQRELFDWTLPDAQVFKTVVAEFRACLTQATNLLDSDLDKLQIAGRRLASAFDVCDQAIALAEVKLVEALVSPITAAQDQITQIGTGVSDFSTLVDEMLASDKAAFGAACKKVWTKAEALAVQVRAMNIPQLASLLKRIDATLQAMAQVAHEGEATAVDHVDEFKNDMANAVKTIKTDLGSLSTALSDLHAQIVGASGNELGPLFDEIAKLCKDLRKALIDDAPWDALDTARAAIRTAVDLAGAGVDNLSQKLERCYEKWRTALSTKFAGLAKEFGVSLSALTLPVANLCAQLRQVTLRVNGHVSAELATRQQAISDVIMQLTQACNAGADALEQKKQEIEARCRELVDAVEARVTGLVTSVIDEATVQKIAGWEKDLATYKDAAGKGLKLVQAIGSLPELPHLQFNADRVEYVFDDIKQQIETSPFAARLREIDSGLKELGLAVPVRQLLDQLVPDKLQNIDFNKIFRDLGGIDFRKLFRKFRLPELDNDNIKITHGIDKPTRSAWVKAVVTTSFKEPQEVFAAGPLSVQTAAMSLQAQTDVKVALDGQRTAETTGQMRSDWALDFSGARLVSFRDVTVTLDGGRFHFDIRPDNIELHPALKFVSDIAKTIGEKIPPCIELVRDSRGVVSGARANLSTIIKHPLSLGVVKIGQLVLVGGLALTLEEGCKFAVAAHMSVGTKSAPIFVQINLLGGGVWLETEARFVDGAITYQGNLGLALGSMEAFNIAGVARGSYSLLLFAYAGFKSGAGASLRAGLSIQGNAQILGIVNAYVLLLLEVVHGDGKSQGHGLLDVEVEIGRWYSINVHKQVERSL